MAEIRPQFLKVGDGAESRNIAYLTSANAANKKDQSATSLGVMWMLGLNSDMISTKATALAEWCQKRGHACTRYEYSAHGYSDGDFTTATIGDWLEESEAIFTEITSGPQILVGSSTGGHMALLLLRRLLERKPNIAERIKGLVLIAPAWDLTEELMWKKFSPEIQQQIIDTGVYMAPSDYGDPYMITKRFIEEGRNHLFAAKPFDPGCPVIILQGVLDQDVPVAHARKLVEFLKRDWVEMIEVSDGEHRMSRPQDLELLFATLDKLVEKVSR